MKVLHKNRLNLMIIPLITFCIQGCSTAASKVFDEGLGNPYSGVECWPDVTFYSQAVTYEVSPFLMPITAVGNVVDLTSSLVVDTILLVPDLLIEPPKERQCQNGRGLH